MTPEQTLQRNKLQNDVHLAAWNVHHITGRTDQTVQQICDLYPDHQDVMRYLSLMNELTEFVKDNP